MKSFSQNTPLTLEDLIPGGKNYYQYRAEMPRQLVWFGDNLTYVKGDTVYTVSFTDTKNAKTLLTLNDINAGLGVEEDQQVKSMGRVRTVSAGSDNLMVYGSNKIYLYNYKTKKNVAVFSNTAEMAEIDLSEESKMLAYTKDNNLYVQYPDGREVNITNDTDKGIVNGQAVHRNEFGINKGIFWSPKGNLLAFYRMDETMVTDYPLVDVSARVAKLKDIKYPMAGMKSHHVTVGVFNPATQQTIFLKTGTPKEKYLTNIGWSPDEKNIYIAELNRGQDTCVLRSYDAVTGKLLTTLFTETHPKYVEPENAVLFLKNDPAKFLWQSKRDGYKHLYLYDTTGKLLKQVTTGNWDVTSVIGFDEKGENLFYMSTEVSPVERHVYKISLKNGKKEKLTKEEGMHYASLSPSGKYIYDVYTSQHNPGKVAITDTKSNKTNIFFTAKNPYGNRVMPEVVLGSLKANDGKSDL